MEFGSVINSILVHNSVLQIINIRLIMVMESKYIKNFHPKITYIFYFDSLDNKEILFHQFLRWILKIMYKNINKISIGFLKMYLKIFKMYKNITWAKYNIKL